MAKGRGNVLPVSLAKPLFLDTLGVGVSVTMFGKVAGETVFGLGSTISQGTVVAVVSFVGTGHYSIGSETANRNTRITY
jgi:hypothetical protein